MELWEVKREDADVRGRPIGVVFRLPREGEHDAGLPWPAFFDADPQIMSEGLESGGGDVRIGFEVKTRVKMNVWLATFLPAGLNVMDERIEAGGDHIRILFEVPSDIENLVGVAALSSTIKQEMKDGICSGVDSLGVLCAVPVLVKELGIADELGLLAQVAEGFVPVQPHGDTE